MEQFNPDMRLIAVDERDLIVSFDSASGNDHGRAAKALRIARDFAELRVEVAGFADTEHAVLGDQKQFQGVITLLVSDPAGAVSSHVLAEPDLWLAALSRNRKGGTYNFPSSQQVLLAVRQGMADALSQALAGYYGKESHIDTLARSPAPLAVAAAGEARAAAPAAYAAPLLENVYRSPVGAANDAADKKRLRNRLIVAAVATPLLVWGTLAASGAGTAASRDPIKAAVVDAMTQDPRSIQAQVDLTKETLKQMGLDPGKAGDTGCLTAQ